MIYFEDKLEDNWIQELLSIPKKSRELGFLSPYGRFL